MSQSKLSAIQSQLSKDQVQQSLNQLSEWFPLEAPQFKSHEELIVQSILQQEEPQELTEIEFSSTTTTTVESEVSVDIELPTPTPCEEAIGMCIVSIVMFVFGLLGLHVSNQERLSRELLRELGPDTLRGFKAAIHNFSVAQGKKNKALALFKIAGGIYKAGGFKAAFKALEHEMGWWAWTKAAIISCAQFTAWFASDGVAFVAEVVLTIMSAEQLIESADKVVETCF